MVFPIPAKAVPLTAALPTSAELQRGVSVTVGMLPSPVHSVGL